MTRYSVSATPDVASVASSVSVAGPVPVWATECVVTGAVASSLTATDFAVSALPALSVERYSTVCVPSAVIAIGAV